MDKPDPKDHTQTAARSERHTQGFKFRAKPGHDIAVANEELPKAARDLKITDVHLRKYGYTINSLRCDAKRHDNSKQLRNRGCRLRIEAAIRDENQRLPCW